MHHYIKVPENNIVIDYDVKEDGKWPSNYTVLNESGNGAHLHYICNGA